MAARYTKKRFRPQNVTPRAGRQRLPLFNDNASPARSHMAAYYNEIDPYAAQWLRNLNRQGHIAPGDVDERSIEDLWF